MVSETISRSKIRAVPDVGVVIPVRIRIVVSISGAVRTEIPEYFTGSDGETHVVDRDKVGKLFGEVGYLDSMAVSRSGNHILGRGSDNAI